MASSYGWIITEDHTEEGNGDAGTIGPRDIDTRIELELHRGHGRAFRMYDDDGELYYSGRIIGHGTYPDLGEEAFRPLDDFGTPNAGATEIRYWVDGSLVTL